MNQIACTILPVLFLAAFPSPLKAALVPVSTVPIVKTAHTKANVRGWDIQVTNVRYLGPVVQGKYELYEAAGTWIAVTVTFRNTAGKKQRADEEPNAFAAELIDTFGKKHDVKEIELKYDLELMDKPYAPNETRTEVWLFDVPNGTQGSQLALVHNQYPLLFKLW
jgi:hypothetical protein